MTTDSTLEETAAVTGFVKRVRERLADLDLEEQRELTDGLEADLTDLVGEHGEAALGDPDAYARELRAAAGLDPEMQRSRRPRGSGAWVGELLDASHARWGRFVDSLPGSPAGFLEALRPAWWVLRAWVALCLFLLLTGRDGNIAVVPQVNGSAVVGGILLLALVVPSVQLGRGRIWPASRRTPLARLVLLALNVAAMVLLVPTVGQQVTRQQAEMWFAGSYGPDYAVDTLAYNGAEVRNVYPYDAQGHPLTGIQLVDQDGRRLRVQPSTYDDANNSDIRKGSWRNGRTELYSVFPLPESQADPVTDQSAAPTMQPAPFASLPPVTMPGVIPSRLVAEATKALDRTAATGAKKHPKRGASVDSSEQQSR